MNFILSRKNLGKREVKSEVLVLRRYFLSKPSFKINLLNRLTRSIAFFGTDVVFKGTNVFFRIRNQSGKLPKPIITEKHPLIKLPNLVADKVFGLPSVMMLMTEVSNLFSVEIRLIRCCTN